MGVYDEFVFNEIVFKCPECMVPIHVFIDSNFHAPHKCYHCGKKWVFDLSEISIPLKEYIPPEKYKGTM